MRHDTKYTLKTYEDLTNEDKYMILDFSKRGYTGTCIAQKFGFRRAATLRVMYPDEPNRWGYPNTNRRMK